MDKLSVNKKIKFHEKKVKFYEKKLKEVEAKKTAIGFRYKGKK